MKQVFEHDALSAEQAEKHIHLSQRHIPAI